MQGAPALRPLGVGDVVDAVITLFRSRPLLFIVVAALPQLVFSIAARGLGLASAGELGRVAEWLNASGDGPLVPPPALDGGAIAAALVVGGVLAVVVFTVQAGALVEAMARRYLREEVTIRSALAAALAAAPRLVGAGFLATILIILGAAAVLSVSILLAVVGGGQAGILGVVGALLALVGTVAVLGFLSASWLVAPVVVMREGAGPVLALRRSWWLANGHRWRILALLGLLLVLQLVLGALFSVIFLAAFLSDSGMRTVLEEAANLAATAVAGPLQWGAFTVLYYDLRVRREAFDLVLAAEALPRAE